MNVGELAYYYLLRRLVGSVVDKTPERLPPSSFFSRALSTNRSDVFYGTKQRTSRTNCNAMQHESWDLQYKYTLARCAAVHVPTPVSIQIVVTG